jgi:hypothetical protein
MPPLSPGHFDLDDATVEEAEALVSVVLLVPSVLAQPRKTTSVSVASE